MSCFQDLIDGKVDELRIAVNIASTNAKRVSPDAGVWVLRRDQFVTIADSLRHKVGVIDTIPKIAALLDELGLEQRFFRLNEAVARWLDDNEPVSLLDFVVL